MKTIVLEYATLMSIRVFRQLYTTILEEHPEFFNDERFKDSLYSTELVTFDCGVIRNLPAIVQRLTTEIRVRTMREYIQREIRNDHPYAYDSYVAFAKEMQDRKFFGQLNMSNISTKAFCHIIALDLANPAYEWGMLSINNKNDMVFISDYEMMGNREISL